jgi:hypothetical protein
MARTRPRSTSTSTTRGALSGSSEILADVVEEGRRVLAAASRDNVPLRLLGGVAVRLRSAGLPPALQREYKDLDFVTTKKGSGGTQQLLRGLGYEPHTAFNTMNSKERLLFFDDAHGRQVDVFVSSFRMCHEIPLERRLEAQSETVPLAELVLTKLQIVELNEKDAQDVLYLCSAYPVADGDEPGTIGLGRIRPLVGNDWGWWRTITLNLDRITALAGGDGQGLVPAGGKHDAAGQLAVLSKAIEATPKSLRWKARARVGERVRWYEQPEETPHHG